MKNSIESRVISILEEKYSSRISTFLEALRHLEGLKLLGYQYRTGAEVITDIETLLYQGYPK